jgi:hypothetical protein
MGQSWEFAPFKGENLKFMRFIVNAGTHDFPHYRLVKGAELCPGGAETISQREAIYTNFDLKARRRSLKQSAGFIKMVGPCVVMQRSNTSVPRSGTKPRRPDTYVRVLYKVENGAVEEWLTRSEYSQLVGEKCAERHLTELIAKFERRNEFVKRCRQKNLDPGTMRQSTDEDRKTSPWLFAEESPHSNNVASTGGHKNSQATFEPELADMDAPGPTQQENWRNLAEEEQEL